MRQEIINKLRAGYPCLDIISHEEQRVSAELRAAAKSMGYEFFSWSITTGLVHHAAKDKVVAEVSDGLAVVDTCIQYTTKDNQITGTVVPNKSIVMLRDFHLELAEPASALIRRLKDFFYVGKMSNRHLVIVGCKLNLPPELEKEIAPIEFAMPDREQIKVTLDGIANSAGKTVNGNSAAILDSAAGLTTTEAENIFAEAFIECGSFDGRFPEVVYREKAKTVKKNGLLEIVDSKITLKDIGGLEDAKSWIIRRRAAFTPEAKAYGLSIPKGLLLVGIAGCGKSLFAKMVKSALGCPLLQLDCGNIFAGHVGESEERMRTIIQTAEAIAPCVLWADEIEKGFSGSKSGSTDGGTAARVFGTFLQWMQEKTKPVFVVATANDITQLPPEFIRKGRFDELFFVDLPNPEEREEIWKIQIAKVREGQTIGRRATDYDITALSALTEGWTGSEIESLYMETLYAAFERQQEPDTALCQCLAKDVVPLSKTMAEQLDRLRNWASGRARRATPIKIWTPTETPSRKLNNL